MNKLCGKSVGFAIGMFGTIMIRLCYRLLFRGGESALYIYIYDHFHILDLPWESPVTWYIAAIGVDFCYYWVHRASHG